MPAMAVGSELMDDVDGDLSDWLCEAGQRRAPLKVEVDAEPSENLLGYFEHLAGRRLRTREEIRLYFQALNAEREVTEQRQKRRRLAWESLLLLVTVAAYLQYYFWNVYIEIESLPRVVVFSAVQAPPPQPPKHLRGT